MTTDALAGMILVYALASLGFFIWRGIIKPGMRERRRLRSISLTARNWQLAWEQTYAAGQAVQARVRELEQEKALAASRCDGQWPCEADTTLAAWEPAIRNVEALEEKIEAQAAELARYREALAEISEKLACDEPCINREARGQCEGCGHVDYGHWCAGCLARATLTPPTETTTP